METVDILLWLHVSDLKIVDVAALSFLRGKFRLEVPLAVKLRRADVALA